MTDKEYQQQLNNCKTKQERDRLNDKYLKFKVRKNRIKNLSSKFLVWFLNNLIAIIALIVALLK